MQGAIAPGIESPRKQARRCSAEGGNAIDACIVAAFAAAVTEGPLTGPTGGGFLLAWVDGETTVLDCFFAAPARPLGEMEEIVIDFGDASTQVFHVGEGSVAVPGSSPASRKRTAASPACRGPSSSSLRSSSRRGSTRPRHSASCTRSSTGILQRDEGGRRIYGVPERIETADFVPTLERIRDAGAQAVAELIPELADDIAAYRVATPEPLRTQSASWRS